MTTDGTGAESMLRDEMEQLRTALEDTQAENARLGEERQVLLQRLERQDREFGKMRDAHDRLVVQAEAGREEELSAVLQGQAEEELRIAMEELQVMTEELEATNQTLREANHHLDQRVEERTSDLALVNAALQASEGTFRAVANLIPDLVLRFDPGGGVRWGNARWFDYTGQVEDQVMDTGWFDAVHPSERLAARRHWADAVATGRGLKREHRLRRADGAHRWFLLRFEPARDEAGTVTGWYGAVTDTHEQRIALDALRVSEARFRTLIEGVPQLVWRSRKDGRWTWSSPQWTRYTGQSQDDSLGVGWLDALHPEDRDRAVAAWDASAGGLPLDLETRILNVAQNRYRHFQIRATPVRTEDGGLLEWLGTSTDVDDMLRLQNSQGVLVAELQHRTRNLMALVQLLVRRTIKGSTSLEDFQARVEERLGALSRVQGLLSRRPDGMRITFDALLHAELESHATLDPADPASQIRLHGPPGIELRSGKVQIFALALHELTTNAVKYGALSGPAGRLDVSWSLEEREPGRHLVVHWEETGVADLPSPGAGPRGGGYGRELIEGALPYQLGARTTFGFGPGGVRCIIEVPLD